MKTLLLKLKSITRSGSHIGRDIAVKIRCDNPKIKLEIKKDVLPDKITIIDQEVFKAETGYQDLEHPLGITIIERDALKEGINTRDGDIKLWSFSGFLLLALLPFFVFAVGYNPETSDEMIKREFADSFPKRQARYRDDITIHRYQNDPSLFVAYEDDGEDWSESFVVGEAKGKKIEWYDVIVISEEKDPIFGVVSARFIDLKGFNYPVLEIWQISHRGHGFLDLYLVNDKELVKLARILAIDNHLEQYQPEGSSFNVGREYVSCGNVYKGEKHALTARYDDQDNDGIDDVILTGRKVEKCDKIIGHNEKGQIILQTDVVGDEPIETVYHLTDLPTLP